MIESIEGFIKSNWSELTAELDIELPKKPTDISTLEVCGRSKAQGNVFFLVFAEQYKAPIIAIKLCRHAKFNHRLKNEYLTLQRIREQLEKPIAETVPKPIFFDRINGFYVLIESGMNGATMRPSKKTAAAHFQLAIDWLINFHTATLSPHIFTDQTINSYIWSPINQYCKSFTITQDEKRLFDRVLKEFKALKGKEVPFVMQQGDFWWHNILISNQAMKVLDWEDSLSLYIPCIDIFHFPLWYGFELTRKGIASSIKEKVRALEAIYFRNNWFSNLAYKHQTRYFSEFKTDMKIANILFIVYLIHKSNQEHAQFLEDFQSGYVESAITLEREKQSNCNAGLYRSLLMKVAQDKLVYGEIV